ncbi:hypothetical protein SAMN05518848_105158 [Paenibacillus sp. PDC88]|nr:hypothetical protein SAMN05518848_105158 [Paenibacillus sp. PDC88]
MMRFGCQTYTWQMTYQVYKHRFSDILDVIAGTGFKGVEAEICMLGAYYEDPALLSEAIESRGLELAALTLAEPWLAGKESAAEREQADRLIRYLQHFPGAKLITVQLPGTDRRELEARQQSGSGQQRLESAAHIIRIPRQGLYSVPLLTMKCCSADSMSGMWAIARIRVI